MDGRAGRGLRYALGLSVSAAGYYWRRPRALLGGCSAGLRLPPSSTTRSRRSPTRSSTRAPATSEPDHLWPLMSRPGATREVAAQRSVVDAQLGRPDHEPAAPLADVGQLLHDLVPQVPGQDEHVVRARLADAPPARGSGCACPGRKRPCLCGLRSTVYVEQVAADAAVVEQRVALGRRAVADDPLALRAGASMRNVEQRRAWSARTCSREAARRSRAGRGRPRARARRSSRARSVTGCAASSACRAKMRSEPPCVGSSSTSNDRQAVRARRRCSTVEQREVREVLVVDRVELVLARSAAAGAGTPS